MCIHLAGNENYWAGMPPLDVVELVTDLGNVSSVQAFQDGTLDYTGISSFDASWIAYDAELGPDLRHSDDFSVSYYGFDTRVPPFDNAAVRLAFAKAVDWRRIVQLGDNPVATSLVPPGIPGRDDVDHLPTYDPDAARQLLADSDFPGGAGFPPVVLATYGVGYEQTVAQELETNLGVEVSVEILDFRDYIDREHGPGAPGIWTLSWSADYPHPHDFLGIASRNGQPQ